MQKLNKYSEFGLNNLFSSIYKIDLILHTNVFYYYCNSEAFIIIIIIAYKTTMFPKLKCIQFFLGGAEGNVLDV